MTVVVAAILQGPKKEVYSLRTPYMNEAFFAVVKSNKTWSLHYSNESGTVFGRALVASNTANDAIVHLCTNYRKYCSN